MNSRLDEQIQSRVGTLLGAKYRLLRVVGTGGMGAVYEAADEVLGRRVAIKLMLNDESQVAGVNSRFLREAQTAARVSHPNIVTLFEVGQDEVDGSIFIAQEFLSGGDLRQLLTRRHALSLRDALSVLVPVMSALEAAHRQGVVHRDVKPENIFLAKSANGTVPKLIDFGVSKPIEPVSFGGQLTTSGAALGTPFYMSPEQARGQREVGPQTDVWAMGVVLYESLGGQRPFVADNYNALLHEILSTDAPVLASVDPGVAQIIRRALDRDPARRYRSMAEFMNALLTAPAIAQEPWLAQLASAYGSGAGARVESVEFFDAAPSEDPATIPDAAAVMARGETGTPLEWAAKPTSAANPPPRRSRAASYARLAGAVVLGALGAIVLPRLLTRSAHVEAPAAVAAQRAGNVPSPNVPVAVAPHDPPAPVATGDAVNAPAETTADAGAEDPGLPRSPDSADHDDSALRASRHNRRAGARRGGNVSPIMAPGREGSSPARGVPVTSFDHM